MPDSYYKPEHLEHFAHIGKNRPELAAKFFDYYGAVMGDGALTKREKCLMALAVSHALQCPYCVESYTQKSLENGADLDQMTEAAHVASAVRGGAALAHGMQMRDHHDDLSM
jgi:alkylhydroperoxidase/carboxymuconolactone decarboxylase family protein